MPVGALTKAHLEHRRPGRALCIYEYSLRDPHPVSPARGPARGYAVGFFSAAGTHPGLVHAPGREGLQAVPWWVGDLTANPFQHRKKAAPQSFACELFRRIGYNSERRPHARRRRPHFCGFFAPTLRTSRSTGRPGSLQCASQTTSRSTSMIAINAASRSSAPTALPVAPVSISLDTLGS